MKHFILLDNIRSLLNVGAIFRSADGAGYSKIYLTGITPTPPRKEISKTALGAEEYVPWEYYSDTTELIDELKKQGVRIVVLEQAENSYMIEDFYGDDRDICLIVGNEVGGVQRSVILQADDIIELPMRGKKQSLNVSVAAGICMYMLTSHLNQ